MFLNQSELETLTGYSVSGWQRRWLDNHQWTYESAANGRVVVSRAYAESRLSGIEHRTKPTLNLAAIRKSA